MSYTTAQANRVQNYRRNRRPESLSDSQQRVEDALTGESRPIQTQPGFGNTFPQQQATAAAAPTSAPPPAVPPVPTARRPLDDEFGNAATPNAGPSGMVSTPGRTGGRPPTSKHPPQPHAGAATGIAAAVAASTPSPDMTEYILELERQNQELREQVTLLQVNGISAAAGFPADTTGFNPIRGQDEKRMFLNDVLSQVEVVVQAHRNKTEAEIQRYKSEAEHAQQALRNLRNAIQQEGMDLSLAPAMISFQRKTAGKKGPNAGVSGEGGTTAAAAGGGDDGRSPLSLSIPVESQQLLEGIAEDILSKLVAVQKSDDVPNVVRSSVKASFESVIVYFTDQLMANFKESETARDELRAEIDSLKQELRTQISHNENQRIQLVQESENEIAALRDELHAFHMASSDGDEVHAAVQEKAMDEYTQMLIEARREVTHLRQELENEKNHSAQVCLKLKTALKKRNADFETAVIQRAEDVVQQRERWIVELETKLREKESEPIKQFNEQGVQAGEPSLFAPSEETYVNNLMLSLNKDPRSTAKHDEMFEKEVWRKTQELIGKYGNRK